MVSKQVNLIIGRIDVDNKEELEGILQKCKGWKYLVDSAKVSKEDALAMIKASLDNRYEYYEVAGFSGEYGEYNGPFAAFDFFIRVTSFVWELGGGTGMTGMTLPLFSRHITPLGEFSP